MSLKAKFKSFFPFSKPDIGQKEIREVVDSLKSGWITSGPKVLKFEDQLKNYLNSPYVLTLNSATAGLHLALLALELKPGDEVITTPMTWLSTVNTIINAGGKPVLIDVNKDDCNIDLDKLEKAITNKTKAIIPVHFAGLPVDIDKLYNIAKKHNIYVIEDAAHAIGAEYKDKKIGSFGDIQVFSFHPNKNITTGEGGCISTQNKNIAEKISIMRFHGIDRKSWDRFSKKGSQDYEVVYPGYKYNMMDIQAAIGIHQLCKLDKFIDKRTLLANRYVSKLKNIQEITLFKQPNYSHKHAWHLFTVLINTKKLNRDEFMSFMKQRNIGTGLHYKAVHLYQYYKNKFKFKYGDFPNAEYISEKIVSLPLFPNMTIQEQDNVINEMKEILK